MYPYRINFFIAALLIVFNFLYYCPAAAEEAPELPLAATSAVLIDAHNGEVLYEQDSRVPLPAASLTKIMTLLLAMEALEQGLVDRDDTVIASQKAWATGGSQIYLNINQEVSFGELIEGIIIASANDACVAVAEHLYGSEEAFVQRMNQRAAELGLENTQFTNSHGLPAPEPVMSALDVARLAMFYIKTQPEAFAYHSEREYTFNDIKHYNRNLLLGRYPGADGIKTGFTSQAGWSLASTAVRDELRFISVVMNSTDQITRRTDSETLLNYGFTNFRLVRIANAGETVSHAPVARGKLREVPLVAPANIELVVLRGQEDQVERKLILDKNFTAPIERGQRLGRIEIYREGALVTESELLAGEDVERLGFFAHIWRSVRGFFGGLWQSITGGNDE